MVIEYEDYGVNLYDSDVELDDGNNSDSNMNLRNSMIARSSTNPNSTKSSVESDEKGEFECEICGDKYDRRSQA